MPGRLRRSSSRRLPAVPATGILFVSLLTGVIVIVGGPTFLLALILGPVAEHFATQAGLPFGSRLLRISHCAA